MTEWSPPSESTGCLRAHELGHPGGDGGPGFLAGPDGDVARVRQHPGALDVESELRHPVGVRAGPDQLIADRGRTERGPAQVGGIGVPGNPQQCDIVHGSSGTNYCSVPSADGLDLNATLDCYAIVPPGLEQLAAGELAAFGVTGTVDTGGVSFRAGAREVYQANLCLRVASRVLVRVAEFRATAFWELEKRARSLPWADLLSPGRAVVFRVSARKSKLYHQEGIAERLCGAVTAAVTGLRTGEEDGAQEFVVRVFRDVVTVSIDSSGALLNQRGYRLASAKAPLRENLGAAVRARCRVDLLTPAARSVRGIRYDPDRSRPHRARDPAGLAADRFAFEEWPGFDASLWRDVRARAESQILRRGSSADPGIRSRLGSDRDGEGQRGARGRGRGHRVEPGGVFRARRDWTPEAGS